MLATGCQGNRGQQRLAKYSPEALASRGESALRAQDYGEAVQIYEAMTSRYPFAPQSRQARLNIIYAYYRLGEKESAKDAAETFVRENPAHPRVDYAWYLKGLIDFENTPSSFERMLGVDQSKRPPISAQDSINSFRTVVEKYPKSIYAADARQRMVYMRNRLADYDIQIAHYYEERKAWVAAAQRARETIERYDGAPAVKEALRVLIRCYNELDYPELAANTEKVFHDNFPEESAESKKPGSRWWKFWG
jgi:outer membrane protein assembly factor BamD